MDCRGHHRLHGFWSSDLHWSDRYILGCDTFFCASTVLVGPNNRAVDLGILVVCLGSQHFKDPLPNATLAPAHVASMNHPKVAKAFGQIAPGVCRRDKDRALPRQRGDYPWQSLRRFPLCRGANAQYVTTDHHGEHSVWWSWDFSSIGKGKRFFSSKKNDIPPTIKCLFDDRP